MDERIKENISDDDRFPTLSDAGRATLKIMQEHENAPVFRNRSGNRLTADDLETVKKFEREVANKSIEWSCKSKPEWLKGFVENIFNQVPYYKVLGSAPKEFEDVPTVCRANLSADIAQFVPNFIALDRLINFQTTGTTGNPLLIASHPIIAACYLPYHLKALRRFGVQLKYSSGQVGVILLGYQRSCFTYVSVTPLMNESGLAKINLHPNDWRDPADREKYLDAMNAEVLTGDPLSFSELLALPLKTKPKALISVGMMLTNGLKSELEAKFSAPVLDIYSLNEVGPVAVLDPVLGGYLLLQSNLFVEILDDNDQPVEPGRRGEITLTGGFNFCMPLLRYKTGDFASLSQTPEGPLLCELSGRKPVRYRTEKGDWINNIDITHVLRPFSIAQFGLHQTKQGELILRLAKSSMGESQSALQALKPIFGSQKIAVEPIENEDKINQYTSELVGGVL